MLADPPRNGKGDKAHQCFRDRVEVGDFSDHDMRVACETLKGKNRDAQAAAIQRVLRQCGVDWSPVDGPPLDAIVKKLKVDGAFQIGVDWLNMQSHWTSGYMPMDAKLEFLKRLEDAGSELWGTREKGPHVLGTEYKNRQKDTSKNKPPESTK